MRGVFSEASGAALPFEAALKVSGGSGLGTVIVKWLDSRI